MPLRRPGKQGNTAPLTGAMGRGKTLNDRRSARLKRIRRRDSGWILSLSQEEQKMRRGRFGLRVGNGQCTFEHEWSCLSGWCHSHRVLQSRVRFVPSTLLTTGSFEHTRASIRSFCDHLGLDVGFKREMCPLVVGAEGKQNRGQKTEPPVSREKPTAKPVLP